MRLVTLLLTALPLLAGDCISKPCTGSTNFAPDLYGTLDTRPGTWGYADAAYMPIHFRPPAGYHVHILWIRGDLIAWRKNLPQREDYRIAGVLLGFSTTAPEGSIHADLLADNTALYIQDAVGIAARRTPFDYTALDWCLGDDSTLVLKIASFLNATGSPLHTEGTAVMSYRFVKE